VISKICMLSYSTPYFRVVYLTIISDHLFQSTNKYNEQTTERLCNVFSGTGSRGGPSYYPPILSVMCNQDRSIDNITSTLNKWGKSANPAPQAETELSPCSI